MIPTGTAPDSYTILAGMATHPHARKHTILLVEDDPIIALANQRTIERAGYHVITASSGEEAIPAAVTGSEIDLVLMDIDLGSGMSGTEAAEIILREQDIPLTFLSSHTDPELVNKTEGITGYGYIVKNTGETVLLASIKMALRLHSSERRFSRVLSEVREVAIQGYSSDGSTNYWNAASERVYGYAASEVQGKKLWELIIPPEMVHQVRDAVQEMLDRGAPHPPETLTLMRKDGSRVRVRSNHVVTRNVNGTPELFCVDIPLDGDLDITRIATE